jgi:hypothetical protein
MHKKEIVVFLNLNVMKRLLVIRTCLRYLPQSCYIKEKNNANARDNLNKLISNKE